MPTFKWYFSFPLGQIIDPKKCDFTKHCLFSWNFHIGIGQVSVGAVYESNMTIESYTCTNRLSHPFTPIPKRFLNVGMRKSLTNQSNCPFETIMLISPYRHSITAIFCLNCCWKNELGYSYETDTNRLMYSPSDAYFQVIFLFSNLLTKLLTLLEKRSGALLVMR